jgi:anaerobic selenocysteine-containing dehydrogenase
MSERISRRDFLKVAGVGVAATAILTGCGPDSRYVVRTPYIKMPEYTYNGLSTYYATTCRECPAGCGLVVRTMQGRAIKVEGNPNHPLNSGKTCSRGQASLQGLYNPDRVQHPLKQSRGGRNPTEMNWDEAINIVKEALSSHQPGEIAFLLGMASDHLADLVSEIARGLGAPAPWRYGAFGMFEGRTTLAQAAEQFYGLFGIPAFDIGGADVLFSFGANFLETYLSPVAFGRGYAKFRKGIPVGKRGYLVQFEPRLSQTGANADEWIPITPGTEGLAALAIGRAAAELVGGSIPPAYQNVDLATIAKQTGASIDTYKRLAGLFLAASHPLAFPGGAALTTSEGLEAARAILALNMLVNNYGMSGGVSMTPVLPLSDNAPGNPSSFKDINTLVESMKAGGIKVLFIHGVNPFFEFPQSLGFAEASQKVSTIISFASYPDETASTADYLFPDHTGLESWGYQRIITGTDRPVISGAQPVVAPFYNTRATADVLLAAVQALGGSLAKAVPYKDVVAFIQHSIQKLQGKSGFYDAPDMPSFWAEWQQYGGWWNARPGFGNNDAQPSPTALSQNISAPPPKFDGNGAYYLHPFPSVALGDGSGANKPWLQETPDPTTTVMWGTWVEIHPKTADKLGLQDDDVVRVISPFGEMEASVYRYPAIRPDTIAIPFGQGHTVYGRYAQGRGANLAVLLGTGQNAAGDLTISNLKVDLAKTGEKKNLARLESKMGVYGKIGS